MLSIMQLGAAHLDLLVGWVGRLGTNVLECPERMRIVQRVLDRPGSSMSELSDALSMSWTQLHYHVTRLEHAGVVRTAKAGRRRLVFPALEADEAPDDRALVMERTARALAMLIAENPRCSVNDLVRLSEETPRVVYYHVKRLLESGLVTSSSTTRHRGLAATPRLLRLLSET